MTLEFEVPEKVLHQLDMTTDQLDLEVRIMIAARMYQRKIASSGRAAETMGVPRALLLDRLALLGVPLYDPPQAELERDIANAG